MKRIQKIKLLKGLLEGTMSKDQLHEILNPLPPIVIELEPGVYADGITEKDIKKYNGRVVKFVCPAAMKKQGSK